MSIALRQQPTPPSAMTELLQWWAEELRDWMREMRRKVVIDEDLVSDLTIAREGLLFGQTQAGPYAMTDLEAGVVETSGKKGLPRSVMVTLAEGRYLKRKLADIRIPLVRAQTMAELDIRTQTPFKLDDVYILFADQPALEEGLSYYLVRRDILDPVLDALQRRGRGLAGLVFQEGQSGRPARAFVTAGFAPRRTAAFKTARKRMFGLACVALLAIAGYNVSAALARASVSVEDAIAAAEPRAKIARERFKARSEFLARVEKLYAEKNNYVPVAKLLEELSFILPDATYLTAVSIRQGKVKVTGFSSNAAELIALVEASGLFANPKFVSAVVQVPDRNSEQFDLEMELEHAD